MSEEIYQFSIGSFQCAVVSDGTLAYAHPAHVFAVNAPPDKLAAALAEHRIDLATWDEYVSPYAPLLIRTGEQTVLVDTGAGSMTPTTGRLLSNLHELGVEPIDIDTVILTHAHPDHIGGNLTAEGRAAFPQARYVISKPEWTFWMEQCDLSSLQVDDQLKSMMQSLAERNLTGVAKQLDIIESDAEIVPGITAIPAPGHTPGHIALAIESEGNSQPD